MTALSWRGKSLADFVKSAEHPVPGAGFAAGM